MGGQGDLVALALAAISMYGLGIPLAWLLPAPEASPWVHRIAVAPVLSIVAASASAFLLRSLGVPLHPLQLLALVAIAWAVAAWRTAALWQLRSALGASLEPALMALTAGLLWLFSLIRFGLYLPNRDFKNHAYFVAQVAYGRTSDSRWVLRTSPLDPALESRGGYPLGLHTLLGWALPTPDWNSVGITAAAAVLATSISLPLAMVTLARMWSPDNGPLALLAGFASVALPGATSPFAIGAVPLLVGTGVYAAGLASAWLWLREPTLMTTLALGLIGVGLLLLHVAEALGLGLVVLACLPGLVWRHRRGVPWQGWLTLLGAGIAVAGAGLAYVRPNLQLLAGSSAAWDIEPNENGLASALTVTLMRVATDRSMAGLLWVLLVLAGVMALHRHRLSWYPAVALLVPVVLGVLASVTFIPDWLRLVTAPWFGATGRVSLLAIPSALLLAALSLVAGLRWVHARIGNRHVLFAAVATLLACVLLAPSAQSVPQRRESLAATLAGAGDTPRVAVELKARLQPEETILNFEGDGGAQLFSMARLPILDATRRWQSMDADDPFAVAITGLGRVDEPSVVSALAELKVRYIVIGSASLYWNEMVGYDLDALLEQPELSLVMRGSELAVLEYRGAGA